MVNFAWVLDTLAGQVKAHRIMRVSNDADELLYWAHEELVDFENIGAR